MRVSCWHGRLRRIRTSKKTMMSRASRIKVLHKAISRSRQCLSSSRLPISSKKNEQATRTASTSSKTTAPTTRGPCVQNNSDQISREKKEEDSATGQTSTSQNRATETDDELPECPVCLESPREGPIFTCENQHLIVSIKYMFF